MIDPAALKTMGTLSRSNAKRRPDVMVHEFEGRITTFAEFDRYTDQVANGLKALGARNVAYWGKNSDVAFELFIGSAKAGCYYGPLNWRLAPAEIVQILERFVPDVLAVGPEFLAAAESIRDKLPEGVKIIAAEGGSERFVDYFAWRDAQAPVYEGSLGEPEDVCLVLFTSGTTGLPKGVMLSNYNLLGQRQHTVGQGMAYDTMDDDSVMLVCMPFAHIGGIGVWCLSFANCATAIITREFRPDEALKHFIESGVSHAFLVPAAVQFIARSPAAQTADFSHVRSIAYGAAPMPLPVLEEALRIFKCDFCQVYGMTETTGSVSLLPPEDHDPKNPHRMKSAGKAIPGQEIKIIDAEGNELPRGEIGEIAIRGGNAMVGYYNNPEATAKTKDKDGWVRSGDAGYMDADGYLYIHDRIKDMIVSGGENVYPAEVESALYAHPAISEAAVIGVPDDKWGEAVKAVVTVKEGQTLDPIDVINFVRERLAHFKCPKTVDVIKEMPRNASGKLLKRELRAPYWEGQDRQVH